MANEPYVVDSTIREPFDWLSDASWSWIVDYSDEDEYGYLDRIYAVLTGDCPLDEYNKEYDSNKTLEELRHEYNREFPPMLGRAMVQLGQALIDGDVKLNIKTE